MEYRCVISGDPRPARVVELDTTYVPRAPEAIREALRREHGLETIYLRQIDGHVWRDDGAPRTVELAPAGAEPDTPRPPNRPPWTRPGWFPEAVGWIDRQLAALGRARTGPTRQHKVWALSCVLKIPTASGPLFFKADTGLPASEARVLGALRGRWGDHIPQVIASRPETHWILMEALGGPEWEDATDETWRALVGVMAQMQIESLSALDAWRARGLSAFTREAMSALLDEALADPALDSGPDALTRGERARLRAATPLLRGRLDEMLRLGPPLALTLHDFRHGNATPALRIFDWNSAVLAPPFLSVHMLLDTMPLPEGVTWTRRRLDEPADTRRRQMRDAWLAAWADHVGDPAALFDLSRSIRWLFRALWATWERHHLEPGAPWTRLLNWRIPRAIRRQLADLDDPVP